MFSKLFLRVFRTNHTIMGTNATGTVVLEDMPIFLQALNWNFLLCGRWVRPLGFLSPSLVMYSNATTTTHTIRTRGGQCIQTCKLRTHSGFFSGISISKGTKQVPGSNPAEVVFHVFTKEAETEDIYVESTSSKEHSIRGSGVPS